MKFVDAATLADDTAAELEELNLGVWTASTVTDGDEFKPMLTLGRVWQLFPHIINGEIKSWSCSSQQALAHQLWGTGQTPAEAIAAVRAGLSERQKLYSDLLSEFPR